MSETRTALINAIQEWHNNPTESGVIRISNLLDEHETKIADNARQPEPEIVEAMVEALEAHEELYKQGILNTSCEDIDRVHALRRAALAARNTGEVG